ncbi:hypothetical protein JB92DRAFT_2853648 [Gautieria morchelliformis]|nr:hypothetical protein JB92DRAFT_2853648 [Gautieria morchelliformis]
MARHLVLRSAWTFGSLILRLTRPAVTSQYDSVPCKRTIDVHHSGGKVRKKRSLSLRLANPQAFQMYRVLQRDMREAVTCLWG